MKITDYLKERIIAHEGIILEAYIDSVGQRTIGIGHALTVTDKMIYSDGCAISEEEAFYLFEKDLERACVSADALIGNLILPQIMQEIIVEMVFQLGKNGVSKFKLMWEALRQHDFSEAAYQMRDSKWHRQTPNRCDDLAKLVNAIKCFEDY